MHFPNQTVQHCQSHNTVCSLLCFLKEKHKMILGQRHLPCVKVHLKNTTFQLLHLVYIDVHNLLNGCTVYKSLLDFFIMQKEFYLIYTSV